MVLVFISLTALHISKVFFFKVKKKTDFTSAWSQIESLATSYFLKGAIMLLLFITVAFQ